MDSSPYTQKQLNEYKQCPEIAFIGSHIAGFTNCFFCAQIYRRYRKQQGTLSKAIGLDQEDTSQKTSTITQTQTTVTKPNIFEQKQESDDDAQCGKMECIRAGWCMCD